MKHLKCISCGFVIKEKLKKCPLCHDEMIETGEVVTYSPNLPKTLSEKNRPVQLSYICYKCRKKTANHICLHCNLPNFLCMEYNSKRAVIHRIEDLSDVYTEKEVLDLLSYLDMQEKAWIYFNLEGSVRFFYQKDKTKAFALFFIAALMYYVCLSIALETVENMLFVSYFVNGFGNGILSTFVILGLWYLFDAATVEYGKIAGVIGLINGGISLIQVVLSIVFSFDVPTMLVTGGIGVVLGSLIGLIVTIMMRKLR